MATVKFRCLECSWCGPEAKVLTAPNPFADDDGETMLGCPECREANQMHRACDAEGCTHNATVGCPIPGGYSWTCYDHRPAEFQK
jgi:hypothetical protein